jgi:DNA polymerase-3 subunit chi
VAEVLFYRLSASPLEATLPDLLEKSLARGWRALVRAGSPGAVALLDEMLWTFRDDSFLPHGLAEGPQAARQPVLLTTGRENLNGAQILLLTLGARADPAEMAGYARACLIFEEADPAALANAREDWRAVAAAGLPAKFWAQQGGRWVQKATSQPGPG